MAMKRQLVIKKLEDEGVFSMNKELPFPAFPQRVAVISSKNAAGYTDFISQLKNNSFGYSFYTALIETSLQGTETELSVIRALDRVADKYNLFDIVVIIRGGGSQSDLSWFDSYNIAYHVTQFPLPVITGIGHDKDVTITDLVASRSLKTPTAVADFLVESMATSESNIIGISKEIIESSRIIIEKNRNRIETFGIKLLPLSRLMISEVRDKLSTKILDILNIGKELIYKARLIPLNQKTLLSSSVRSFVSQKEMMLKKNVQRLTLGTINYLSMNNARLNSLGNNLQILNPENVLQRGYSITSVNGKILKKSDSVKNNDIIDTQLYEGTLRSRVMGKDET
jgi:exodeoxyribonuclease VII large subunit